MSDRAASDVPISAKNVFEPQPQSAKKTVPRASAEVQAVMKPSSEQTFQDASAPSRDLPLHVTPRPAVEIIQKSFHSDDPNPSIEVEHESKQAKHDVLPKIAPKSSQAEQGPVIGLSVSEVDPEALYDVKPSFLCQKEVRVATTSNADMTDDRSPEPRYSSVKKAWLDIENDPRISAEHSLPGGRSGKDIHKLTPPYSAVKSIPHHEHYYTKASMEMDPEAQSNNVRDSSDFLKANPIFAPSDVNITENSHDRRQTSPKKARLDVEYGAQDYSKPPSPSRKEHPSFINVAETTTHDFVAIPSYLMASLPHFKMASWQSSNDNDAAFLPRTKAALVQDPVSKRTPSSQKDLMPKVLVSANSTSKIETKTIQGIPTKVASSFSSVLSHPDNLTKIVPRAGSETALKSMVSSSPHVSKATTKKPVLDIKKPPISHQDGPKAIPPTHDVIKAPLSSHLDKGAKVTAKPIRSEHPSSNVAIQGT
jgi:hypothetical protein